MPIISDNLADIKGRIRQALEQAKREPGAARLLAVSKTFPAEDILVAYQSGQREFGENRPQELEQKAPKLPKDIVWHLIGHLQANKVRSAVTHASWIHSVDTMALLKRIDRIAGEEGRHPTILLEINVSGEESKFGLKPSEVLEVAQAAEKCENVTLSGLMTMAPADAGPEELHDVFRGLRQLRDELASRLGRPLPVLSMGMSHDFEIAVEEGSTLVRVGTAIFGGRPPMALA